MTFDLRTVYNEKRPLSWSAISSFGWNKRQWHHKYVVHGKCTYADPVKGTIAMCVVVGFADPECPVVKKTIELAFGSMVDKKIQDEPDFIPELVRYPIMQHTMRATFDGIPLIGVADTFLNTSIKIPGKKGVFYAHKGDIVKGKAKITEPSLRPALRDYKTGRNKWTQQRADETGQLTNYSFLLYLIEKIKPEDLDLFIDWLPTHTVKGEVVFLEDPVRPHVFPTKRTMRQVLQFGQTIKDTWKEMEAFAQNATRYESNSLEDW